MCNISKVYILITLFLLYLTCIRYCCVCEHPYNPINIFFKLCIILNSLIPYFIFSLILMLPVVPLSQKYRIHTPRWCRMFGGKQHNRIKFRSKNFIHITNNLMQQTATTTPLPQKKDTGIKECNKQNPMPSRREWYKIKRKITSKQNHQS
jgi:hypothetical protein